MKSKKAISAVVETVLLVLISVIAIGLIAGFVIPMIRENLQNSGSCFQLRDYASIADSEYSCYNSENTSLMVQRGMDNYSIAGFAISILSGSESKRYDITSGNVQGVSMLNKTGMTEQIEIPSPGASKTYVFDISGNKVQLGIITKSSKICDMGSRDIPAC